MLAQLCVPGANGWKVCYLQSTWRQSDNTLCSFFMLQSSLLISLSQLHGNATVRSTSKSSVLLHHSPSCTVQITNAVANQKQFVRLLQQLQGFQEIWLFRKQEAFIPCF